MSVLNDVCDSLADYRRKEKESEVEENFRRHRTGQKFKCVKEIPLRIVHIIHTKVTGKVTGGVTRQSEYIYRKKVWDWLTKIWAGDIGPNDRSIIVNIRQSMSNTVEFRKLQLLKNVPRMDVDDIDLEADSRPAALSEHNCEGTSLVLDLHD